MRYPPSVLEEIKARLPASVVVGRRVKLIKAGREFKGLSPFNAEKSPSFFVNDSKQAWFDFSSGRNGDIFTFLMEAEGLSFSEAVERLAGEAGVELPKETPESEMREKRRATLYDVMGLAQEYFAAELKGTKGREAREYCASRGLVGPVAAKFGIGYAPNDRHGLRDFLAGKDVAVELMVEAGLLIKLDDNPVAYDRFRDRVMFPIHDSKGRVIAFGGRALQKDAQAKYLNSPETPIFHKGHNL
ncbi:MAG: DNA primase, partial [Proteobacteria bacterium]|nr:DNA primase [Pseudomonadota bacterium]